MAFPVVRPVILCGGSGTRLWPASREDRPKQFAPLVGALSTFQLTLQRVNEPSLFGRPLVVTNHAQAPLARAQMEAVGIQGDILLEPMARDSGPAILAAATYLDDMAPGSLALVLAADHLVRDVPAFLESVRGGLQAAEAGHIVTFGIVPTSPATGYGYIEAGAPVAGSARAVARFVEKPDSATAIRYIADGFLWNSGNFMFAPGSVIAEYQANDAETVAHVRAAVAGGVPENGALAMLAEAFIQARKISFDFAVMEKTRAAAVVAGSFGWSDIGGWEALWEIGDKDKQGNVSQGDVVLLNSANCYGMSESPLVALLGVENLVVVATGDVVLVADKARAAEVKGLVERLREQGREAARRFPKRGE